VFGYPVTDEYIREEDGVVVQYFERARFELLPGRSGPFVALGDVGVDYVEEQGYDFDPVPPIPDTADQRYFPETGHTLRGTFKRFWDGNNGAFYFGAPISEEVAEVFPDGQQRLVQYFERARFELRPDGSVALGLVADDLAPCQQKVRRPQGLPPSGPGLEGDPRSCDQPDKIAMGRVFPATGLPGGRYGFEAINYRPGEEVKLWINNPDGSVRRLNYGAIADSNGYVIIAFDTEPDDDLGNYSLVGQGERSRRLVLAPFRLAR
jgi:hypothetical protein